MIRMNRVFPDGRVATMWTGGNRLLNPTGMTRTVYPWNWSSSRAPSSTRLQRRLVIPIHPGWTVVT